MVWDGYNDIYEVCGWLLDSSHADVIAQLPLETVVKIISRQIDRFSGCLLAMVRFQVVIVMVVTFIRVVLLYFLFFSTCQICLLSLVQPFC